MHNNVIENIPKMTDTKNNSNVVKGNLDRIPSHPLSSLDGNCSSPLEPGFAILSVEIEALLHNDECHKRKGTGDL